MPLMPKSKKPMSSQDNNLSMAYGMKRRAKKAKGGPISAAQSEKRPMPEQRHNDAKDVAQADHKRDNGMDGWTDQPTKAQAVMNNGRAVKPIKHPSMTQSPSFKVKLRDEEDHLQESADVNNGPQRRPSRDLDEAGPDRQGPSQPSLKMKMMAKGGMINEEVPFEDSEEDMVEHPAHLEEEDDDQMRPSEDEIMADHFAKGGEVDADEEMAIDHAASIAAAIMAKRHMARGGEILSEDSMESDDSDMADLNRNAEEDANMEDKASFDAIRKENYSESSALDDADHPEDSNMHSPEHDEEDVNDRSITSRIRRKMKSKSPITR